MTDTFRKIQTFGDATINPDTPEEVTLCSGLHDAIELNGVVLVRLGFGDYMPIDKFSIHWEWDQYEELLKANPHLTRSDLM